jgi:hypothetical protein
MGRGQVHPTWLDVGGRVRGGKLGDCAEVGVWEGWSCGKVVFASVDFREENNARYISERQKIPANGRNDARYIGEQNDWHIKCP